MVYLHLSIIHVYDKCQRFLNLLRITRRCLKCVISMMKRVTLPYVSSVAEYLRTVVSSELKGRELFCDIPVFPYSVERWSITTKWLYFVCSLFPKKRSMVPWIPTLENGQMVCSHIYWESKYIYTVVQLHQMGGCRKIGLFCKDLAIVYTFIFTVGQNFENKTALVVLLFPSQNIF